MPVGWAGSVAMAPCVAAPVRSSVFTGVSPPSRRLAYGDLGVAAGGDGDAPVRSPG